MLSDVVISRDYPIVNGYVQAPNNRENSRNYMLVADALTAIPGSTVVSLSMGSGTNTGWKAGAQKIFRCPADAQLCCTPYTDNAAEIAAPAPDLPDFPA